MSQKNVLIYHQEKPQILNPNLQNVKSEDNTTLITLRKSTITILVWRSKYLKHVTIVAQRNNNHSVNGNCSSARGNNSSGKGSQTTIVWSQTISFNTTHEKKNHQRETNMRKHATQKNYYCKKMKPKHDLGPLYRAIAWCIRFERQNT